MKLAPLLLVVMSLGCASRDMDPNRPDGPIDCDKACSNMQSAGCEEAEPSPEQSIPCSKWCLDYHYPRGEKGYMPPWAGCVAAAGENPDTIRSCGISCTQK